MDIDLDVDGSDSLSKRFDKAASFVASSSFDISTDDQLYLYSHYKQGTVGECNIPKPGFFDLQAKKKWEAWNNLKQLPEEKAMELYINKVTELDASWEISAPIKIGWVSVSTMMKDEEIKDSEKNLFDFVQENNLDKVKSFPTEKLSVLDENGMSLLHWASDRGYLEMAQYLVEKFPQYINTQDIEGQTPLHYAVSCSHEKVIKFLLENDANINIKDEEGNLPINLSQSEHITDMLDGSDSLSKTFDKVASKTSEHITDMLDKNDFIRKRFDKAASFVSSSSIEISTGDRLYLYSHYKQGMVGECNIPKPGFFNSWGKKKWEAWNNLKQLPKEKAMEHYVNKVTELDSSWELDALWEVSDPIKTSMVSVSPMMKDQEIKDSEKNLFDFVQKNNLDKVKSFPTEELSVLDENGMSLLHWASDRGYLEMVQYLVEKFPQYINTQDTEGQTPLHYAVSCSHEKVIKFLLENDADINIKDEEGNLPINLSQNENITDMLDGRDSLSKRFDKAASFVASSSFDISTDDRLYLYSHCKQGMVGKCNIPKLGSFDLQAKKKWEAWNNLKQLPEEKAMELYINKVTELDASWEISAPIKIGWVSVSTMMKDEEIKDSEKNLFDFVQENNLDKVKSFPTEKLSVLDENGMSLLHWASDRGYLEMVQYLVEKFPQYINTQDTEGQTPLHYAVSCSHEKVIKFLLENDADINIKDEEGNLPINLSQSEHITDMLKQFM